MLAALMAALEAIPALATIIQDLISAVNNLTAALHAHTIAQNNAAIQKGESDLNAAQTPAQIKAAAQEISSSLGNLSQ